MIPWNPLLSDDVGKKLKKEKSYRRAVAMTHHLLTFRHALDKRASRAMRRKVGFVALDPRLRGGDGWKRTGYESSSKLNGITSIEHTEVGLMDVT